MDLRSLKATVGRMSSSLAKPIIEPLAGLGSLITSSKGRLRRGVTFPLSVVGDCTGFYKTQGICGLVRSANLYRNC